MGTSFSKSLVIVSKGQVFPAALGFELGHVGVAQTQMWDGILLVETASNPFAVVVVNFNGIDVESLCNFAACRHASLEGRTADGD